jgi:hypothetical protein
VPAPQKAEIKENLRAAFLASGNFPNHDKDGNAIPAELPEGMEKILDAVAEGLAATWTTWQARQTVVGQASGVTSGPSVAPVTGTIP